MTLDDPMPQDWNSVITAPPETYYLCADHASAGSWTVVRHVVCGWVHIQGAILFPLMVVNREALGGQFNAIEHPGGYVSDNRHSLTFQNTKEWLNFLEFEQRKKVEQDLELQADLEDIL